MPGIDPGKDLEAQFTHPHDLSQASPTHGFAGGQPLPDGLPAKDLIQAIPPGVGESGFLEAPKKQAEFGGTPGFLDLFLFGGLRFHGCITSRERRAESRSCRGSAAGPGLGQGYF